MVYHLRNMYSETDHWCFLLTLTVSGTANMNFQFENWKQKTATAQSDAFFRSGVQNEGLMLMTETFVGWYFETMGLTERNLCREKQNSVSSATHLCLIASQRS